MAIRSRVKSLLAATFLGTSHRNGPQASVVAGRLRRPEGERHYLLASPTQAAPGPRPLVVILHGAGASAQQVLGMAFPPSPLSAWLEIAEREQVVVIAADAGKQGWSDCFASAQRVARQDDVAFVDALIDLALARHGVDPARVHVIGVSRGGLLAYRIALEIPHRLAAFSAVLAGMPPPARVPGPTVPLPALIFGSTSDPLMPYRGGKYFYTLGFMDPVSSIVDSAKAWRQVAGLPESPAIEHLPHANAWDRTRATRLTWGTDPARLQVCLYSIEGGGHAEPSRLHRYPIFINKLVGAQNADLETAEAAWDFFKDKRAAFELRRPS